VTAGRNRDLEALAARYGGDDLGLTFARVAEHFERHTPPPPPEDDSEPPRRCATRPAQPGGRADRSPVPVRVAVDELMALARRITARMSC
jgi:hypothetical protein